MPQLCKFQIFNQAGTNWQQSRDECVKMGADLATFDSPEEFEELRFKLGEVSQTDVYWFGYRINGPDFKAVNGLDNFKKAEEFMKNFWHEDEPDSELGE